MYIMGLGFKICKMYILLFERKSRSTILTAVIDFYSNDHRSYLLFSKIEFDVIIIICSILRKPELVSLRYYSKLIAFFRGKNKGLYLCGFTETGYIRNLACPLGKLIHAIQYLYGNYVYPVSNHG